MSTYSVLLLRPDHMTDGGEPSYFYTFVEAADVAGAADAARNEATVADGYPDVDLTDYALVLVLDGAHADLSHLDPRES
jgi:hypothetical protein